MHGILLFRSSEPVRCFSCPSCRVSTDAVIMLDDAWWRYAAPFTSHYYCISYIIHGTIFEKEDREKEKEEEKKKMWKWKTKWSWSSRNDRYRTINEFLFHMHLFENL